MKQHITPKQAQEISEEQFNALFEVEGIVKRNDWHNYHHKKVTIGKMIEFLKSQDWKIEITYINGKFRVANDICSGFAYSRKELCDALWDAVKANDR